MEIVELENRYFFHDEEITNIIFDEENKTLQINVNFCEWQLENLKERGLHYTRLEMLFKDVEQFLSYDDIAKIIDDENTIHFIRLKQNSNRKTQVIFGLDHFEPHDPNIKVAPWFFIEFCAKNVEVREL